MPTPNPLLLAYYGDDFTGSTDALEMLTRAGARTVLFIAPPTPEQLANYPGIQAIGVAGKSRSLAPDAMEAELRPAFSALRALGAPHVHYKVCSTFDSSPTVGSIGRAIDVAAEIFRSRFIPLLVAAPALGRFCVFGNLFARMGIGSAGEIHRLDRHPSMRQHPSTPMSESDLRLHLAQQTSKRIGLLDILQIARPETEAHAMLDSMLSAGTEIVLFDALYPEHMLRIGALIDAYASPEHPLFSVGSSGIEAALGAHWSSENKLTPRTDFPTSAPATPLLVISGSCSPVTEKQIAYAKAQGFAEVALDTAALAEQDANDKDTASPVLLSAINSTVASLKTNPGVIVHTNAGAPLPRMNKSIDTALVFGTALGVVARVTIEQTGVKRLVIAGGDTSSYAARALGIEGVEMLAPLAPGAPLCQAHAPGSPADGLEVNFKGGQVGAEDYFVKVAEGKM